MLPDTVFEDDRVTFHEHDFSARRHHVRRHCDEQTLHQRATLSLRLASVGRSSPASMSFVLASLRALHLDSGSGPTRSRSYGGNGSI